MKKHSLIIRGHATSLTLEPVFWTALDQIAREKGTSRTALITQIDATRITSLSGAVRVFVLETLLQKNGLSDNQPNNQSGTQHNTINAENGK